MFDIAIYSMCDTFWHVWCHVLVYRVIHVQLALVIICMTGSQFNKVLVMVSHVFSTYGCFY